MSIKFFDDYKYIRVNNSATGVVSYISKQGLVIQQDSNTCFFLKNDSFYGYYKITDVTHPIAADVTDLVQTLVSLAQNEGTASSPLSIDIKDSVSIAEISVPYDKNAYEVDEILTAGATTTHDPTESSVSMTLDAVADSRAVRQSKEYISIPSGKEIVTMMSGSLIDATPKNNVVSRIGMFDQASDATQTTYVNGYGVFFQFDSNTGTSVVLRNPTTDTVIPQSQWNINNAEFFNPQGLNTFVFSIGNIQGMSIKAGVYHNGTIVIVHQFDLPVDFNYATRLPMRWEILSSPGLVPDVATMIQKKGVVYSSNVTEPHTQHYSTTNSISKFSNTVGEIVPLCSIRLQSSHIRGKIEVKVASILNSTPGGLAKWAFVLNGTLSDASFAAANSFSYAEYSSAETAIAGGTVIASGFFHDIGAKSIVLEDTSKLLASIDGTADTLTLVVTNISGSLTLFGGLTWEESE